MRSLIFIAALIAAGCNSGVQTESANSNTSTATDAPVRTGRVQSTTEHTLENRMPNQAPTRETASSGRWTQSGDPIDTKEFDAAIAAAEKQLKAKPKDPAAKAAAVDAYFKRGFALTEARQYASALGDYRRALRLDPGHAESQKWQKQIIDIYGMLRKEYPAPGEEPPPLQYRGESE